MSRSIRGQCGHLGFFFDWQEKHKHWDLASWQVLLNSVQQVSEEKSKMHQAIRGQGGNLVFRSARKTKTWSRTLRSCFLSRFVEFRSAVSEEKSKILQPIRCHGGHLVSPIGPKNTNLVEDVEILLPVKFCWIPFNDFREVQNVSANQRPGWPSCFSDRLEKQKFGTGH